MKTAVIVVLMGIILTMVVIQTFQLANLKEKITGLAVGGTISGSGGKLDTSSWTANEKMNYEMHGTIPARASGGNTVSAPAGSGMVGGC